MKDEVVKPLLDYLSHMTRTNKRMKSFNTFSLASLSQLSSRTRGRNSFKYPVYILAVHIELNGTLERKQCTMV